MVIDLVPVSPRPAAELPSAYQLTPAGLPAHAGR
jgi:hypothetical protein